MTQQSKLGILYLIPSPIDPGNKDSIPSATVNVIREIKYMVVERARTARRFIKLLVPDAIIDQYKIIEAGSVFEEQSIQKVLKWLESGKNVGIMSEAGSPAIADPGSNLVLRAHLNGIQVRPLVGPNSIIQALMASGLNGQSFVFHGYFPNKKPELKKKLTELMRDKRLSNFTHICIEAPYRNLFLFTQMKNHLYPKTKLCIASGLDSKEEKIVTKSLAEWNESEVQKIHKVPAIFLFEM